MARIRTIKPDFYLDDKLAELDPYTRIVFSGLWTQADREGKLKDEPKKLKVILLPYDNKDMDKMLGNLNDSGFITRYGVGGKKYIKINNFLEHQRPHHTEQDSMIPDPEEETVYKQPCIDGDNRVGRERKGREEKGKEGSVEKIVSYLNQIVGTKYRTNSGKTKALVIKRLSEGFTIKDFFMVIDKKFYEWGTDEKMSAFLRPETLFGNKFESYLNQQVKESKGTGKTKGNYVLMEERRKRREEERLALEANND